MWLLLFIAPLLCCDASLTIEKNSQMTITTQQTLLLSKSEMLSERHKETAAAAVLVAVERIAIFL